MQRIHRIVIGAGLAAAVLLAGQINAQAPQEARPAAVTGPSSVYFNDFETVNAELDSKWTDWRRDTTPNGQGFRGRYGNEVTRLNLQGLPSHGALRLTFDLYIIQSWDGSIVSPGAGPDFWHLGVGPPESEQPLYGTVTFSNWPAYSQSYPALHGAGLLYPAQTGAVQEAGAVQHLGYNYPTLPAGEADAVYRITRYVPHSGSGNDVTFSFSAGNLQSLEDESWGLDNVCVEALPADITPPTCRTGSVVSADGRVYLPVTVADTGSWVSQVQLTNRSTNCKLEWDGPGGLVTAPIGGTIVINPAASSTVVRAVKLNNSQRARVELRVTDVAGNYVVCDPVIANLELKKGGRLSRTFRGIPEHEHYITIQNDSPGLNGAKLWVNGHLVSHGKLAAGQVVTLDVAQWMRRGKNNTVHLLASGPAGAKAVLLIGDASLAGSGGTSRAAAVRGSNLEFSR